jgi:hypothetical protein
MAINPFDRPMFNRRLPGVNPAQVAGGIHNLSNMGNPTTASTPVAAQPLKVARTSPDRSHGRMSISRPARIPSVSLDTESKSSGPVTVFDPFGQNNRISSAVRKELPKELGKFKDDLKDLEDFELQGEWKDTNDLLRATLMEGTGLATTENTARRRATLLAYRDEVAREAGNRGIELPLLGEDDTLAITRPDDSMRGTATIVGPGYAVTVDSTTGEIVETDAETDAVNKLKRGANNETNKAVSRGEVSPADASNLKKKGNELVTAVRGAETDLNSQIKLGNAQNVLKGATAENYNKLAKEYLGLDPKEKDVPEWAAPIFLFGLNLMKAPASTKTSDTGLGGLLADIGTAGEVAFKDFRTERERKRKERASIAQIALSLKKSDDATRIAAYSADLKSKKYWLDYSLKVKKESRLTSTALQTKLNQDSTFMATQFDRIQKNFTSNQNIDGRSAWGQAFNDAINKIAASEEVQSGKVDLMRDVWRNPVRLNLLGKIAAGEAGLRPDFKKDTITFGPGIELTFDVNALKRYAKKNKIGYGQALDEMTKDSSNTKFAGIALATNLGKDQFQVVAEKKGGITTPTYIDTAKRNVEIAAAQTENRDVDPTKFTKYGQPYLTDAPTFKKLDLGNVGNVSKYMYVDFGQLALENTKRRKANKDPLTIQEIGKEPTKYSSIVSSVHRDTSGALNNISNIEINTGPSTTQDFLLNRNILDTRRNEIAAVLNKDKPEAEHIKPEDVIAGKVPYEVLEQFGVLTPLYAERDHSKPITVTEFNVQTGKFTTRTGKPNEIIQLTTQASRDKVMAMADSTAVANSQAFRLRYLFKDAKDPMSLTTALTDLKASGIGALRLTGIGPKVSPLAALNDFIEGGGADSAGRTGAAKMRATREMISNWSGRFDTWAKGAIKDGAARQRMKSLFIDMAFNLASTREGGKLTDNDVNWAFKTLGWDNSAYFQNPQIVMAGLDAAVKTMNFKMDQKLASLIPDAQKDEIDKWNANPDKLYERSALGDFLRQRMRGVSAGEGRIRSPVMTSGGESVLNEQGVPVYIYRYDRRPGWKIGPATDGQSAPRTDGQSASSTINYGGGTVVLKAAPSVEASAVINMLEEAQVPRTLAGVQKYFKTLKPDQIDRVKKQLNKLNELGFFGEGD